MSELWYDSIQTSTQMELMCREEPSLVSYNYGEDLQVLRERIAELEAERDRWKERTKQEAAMVIEVAAHLKALREAATKVYENSWMHKRDKPEAHEAMMAMGAALQEVKRD